LDRNQNADARSTVKAEPRVDIHDRSDDRRQEPFLELHDRLAFGDFLVASWEMEQQIDGSTDPETLKHCDPLRAHAGNELNWSDEIQSGCQGS
jgi:hypothetical protein